VTEPFVGPPTEDGNGCAFSVDLDTPACGAAPTVHILSEALGWGLVGLEGCDAHSDIARTAGAVVAEHAYGPGCPDCWAATP
jgi:hypothetical protein